MTKYPSLPLHSEEIPHHPLKHERQLKVVGHWLGSLLPSVLVVATALLLFREAVFSSIASTPHPELVYAILGTFLLGIVLTSLTLYRYTIEGNLIHQWAHLNHKKRAHLLRNLEWNTYLLPLFEIMLGERKLSPGSRQAVVEQEIVAVNDRFSDRLSLPNYLAGALVGLGLVGTFVGLLGTLEDLGKLFGALVQTGSANANPVDIFSDMVRRLQDPMRGMGTAFVASLYGLLGSLILGLQILAVGKIGRGLIHQLHVLVRRTDIPEGEVSMQHKVANMGNFELERSEAQQAHLINGLSTALTIQHERQQTHAETLHKELQLIAQNNQAFTEKIYEQISNSSKITLDEQTRRWQEMTAMFRTYLEQSHGETQSLRREISNISQTCESLAIAVRASITAEEKFRQVVPKTTYWQEAWIKVQAYLQRSETDQTLTELTNTSKQQSQLLIDISNTLNSLRSDRLRN